MMWEKVRSFPLWDLLGYRHIALTEFQPKDVGKTTMDHGRRNYKDNNPLMSSLLVIFVWGGEEIV
jgi:hypothetical protein